MEEPIPLDDFPQLNPSDLSLDFHDTNFSDLDLDNIDLDFSIEDLDLFLNQNDSPPISNSNSNSNSNITFNANHESPESGNSYINQQSNKRKFNDDDDDDDDGDDVDKLRNTSPNSNSNSNEDQKRKTRLLRNRESAQLSRQRKKQYVEELEQKVKILNSTIADLNGKVSFYMAENVRLHNLLNSNANGNSNVVVNPPTPYHYPWVPYVAYPMKPNGHMGNYVPIPRLKNVDKDKNKKDERKRKKLASVSLFGMLLLGMVVIGGVMNYGSGGSGEMVGGKVFKVKGREHGFSNNTSEFGMFSGNMDKIYPKVMSESGVKYNSSESLPALLYVPRNGKNVEINGNLIIHSVLASDRASTQEISKTNEKELLGKEATSLAIASPTGSALATSKSRACGNMDKNSRALTSDPHGAYMDSMKSNLADGALQQWFLEGLAGPMLSSGTCTELFQFEVSPSAVSPSGIIPAASVRNTTDRLTPSNIKSRRMGQPIQLDGTAALNNKTLNNKTRLFEKPIEKNDTFHSKSSVPSSSSMVVSVLYDPREVGDEYDGLIAPKSISRIFVVVLVDSVKYITYSCMLPFKSHVPHIVN